MDGKSTPFLQCTSDFVIGGAQRPATTMVCGTVHLRYTHETKTQRVRKISKVTCGNKGLVCKGGLAYEGLLTVYLHSGHCGRAAVAENALVEIVFPGQLICPVLSLFRWAISLFPGFSTCLYPSCPPKLNGCIWIQTDLRNEPIIF